MVGCPPPPGTASHVPRYTVHERALYFNSILFWAPLICSVSGIIGGEVGGWVGGWDLGGFTKVNSKK